jgi:phage terminase large subunit GpA-like protein
MPVQAQHKPTPARFANAGLVIADALEAARIPENMAVSAAAEKYLVLDNPGGGYSGPMTFKRTEFLRRPMDCLHVDAGYSTVVVMGPAQTFKSTIGNGWFVHTIKCDPADTIMVMPDKDTLGDYVATQINKMIELSDALKARMLPTNNVHRKEFLDCTFFFKWPVKSQLRARPLPRYRVDDYDAFEMDIGGEGNVITLLTGRQATFEGYDVGYVNSSPALGALLGIEGLVARGTDEHWYVDCLYCLDPFDLCAISVLEYDKTGTAQDARESARVVCPECGGAHDQGQKSALMQSGRWVGHGERAISGGKDGELLPNRIASFRFDGKMGARSWPAIAEATRGAEITFERSQDETELKTVVNTWHGHNFKSRRDDLPPIDLEILTARAAAGTWKLGQVPPGVVCLTLAVDVQGAAFELLARGWFIGGESAIVDRYPIVALDDGMTRISPGTRPEHWQVLLAHGLWRRWPMAENPEITIGVLNMAVDTGGIDNTTANAYDWYASALHQGVPDTSITLIKGGNDPKAKLLPPATTETKTSKATGTGLNIELFVPNVHRFKDITDIRLRRPDRGPGYIGLPSDMPKAYLEELVAEEKVNGLWVRKEHTANETWDLLNYSDIALRRVFGNDLTFAELPDWARPQAIGKPAPAPPAGDETRDQAADQPARPRPPARRATLRQMRLG